MVGEIIPESRATSVGISKCAPRVIFCRDGRIGAKGPASTRLRPCNLRRPSTAQRAVSGHTHDSHQTAGFGVGFRMPAGRDLSTGAAAGGSVPYACIGPLLRPEYLVSAVSRAYAVSWHHSLYEKYSGG